MNTDFTKEWIASVIVLLLVLITRIVVSKLVRRYAKSSQIIEKRANLVIKYLHILLSILMVIAFVLIWGVDKKAIFLTVSSITTVVGVAMFATWSILSNITAGVILFFFFPFRIGDTIKIHDKDFPVEGEILDVRKSSEYLSEHVVDVENAPLDFINDSMLKINKDKTYFVHCAGGYRSMIFNSTLRARGYDNLIDVNGGFKAIKESEKFDLTEYVCPTTLL